jgi:hypothetical protein
MKNITIDGIKYTLDVEEAKCRGILKKIKEPITSIKTGDVFSKSPNSTPLFIIQLWGNKFSYFGLGGGLQPFSYAISDTEGTNNSLSQENMIEFLNKAEYEKVGNLNEAIKTAFCSILKNS